MKGYCYERRRYVDPYCDYDWDNDGFPGEYIYGDDVYVDDYYMDEVWKPIRGFPDYCISDRGHVWSAKTQRFIKPKRINKHGHLGVNLCRYGHVYYKTIHRLVAEAFIPNPKRLPVVRHLDDDPENNFVENLAWGTQRENFYDCISNGTAHILLTETPIIAINEITNERLYFRSQAAAGRSLNIAQANIWKVLHGERERAGGYRFEYAEEGASQNGYN